MDNTKIDTNEIKELNNYFKDVTREISNNTSGANVKRNNVLNDLIDDVDDVLYGEVKKVTDFTGTEVSKFLTKLYNDMDSPDTEGANYKGNKIDSMEDLFKAENGSVFNFFQERYRNKNFLYDDLSLICSQLFELKEAVLTTRDSIVTADDSSNTISRTLSFEGGTDTDLIPVIESLETDMKLALKIKNHIIPKTLQYGSYYVYTVPYSIILDKYNIKKNKEIKNSLSSVQESLMESAAEEIKNSSEMPFTVKQITDQMTNLMGNISVVNEDYTIPVMESLGSEELAALHDDKSFKDILSKIDKDSRKKETSKPKGFSPEAVIDTDKSKGTKTDDFKSVKGCHIKLISPKTIIPIQILDNVTIGYYYITENANMPSINRQTSGAMNKAVNSSFTSNANSIENRQDLEKQMVGKISDMVVKSFDKKFLEKNSKFKELIANALMFDDLYKKNVQFQFIEKEYITEFKVNEDEEGNGVSILADSLFYSKLYLALLLFKMITILTKSNDTKLHYVKNSSVDKNVSNKVQEIARGIKSRQINMNDMMNYNSLTTKLGANKDIFMPVGRSGERAIEFDILAGQDVQLDTDLMEKLRTNAISSTGVPSVMMSYINEADYARTLVMANAKHMSRVGNYQVDFNPQLTELYKKLLRFCTDHDEEKIQRLIYKLNSPKTLNNTNLSDNINNAETVISFMVENIMGKESDMTDGDRLLKDEMFNSMMREFLPMLPWNTIDEHYKNNKLAMQRKMKERKIASSNSESE